MWQDPPSHAPALELVAHAPQWALERESRWQRRAPLRGESAAEVSLETRLPPLTITTDSFTHPLPPFRCWQDPERVLLCWPACRLHAPKRACFGGIYTA